MAEDGSSRQMWWPSPSLPYFSGEPADGPAEDFVAEVDRVLAAYPMGSEMAAYFIYSHLTGTARREVKLYGLEETNTPEKVINILLGVFGDGRRITTLLSAFYSRDQQPGETILDYSHAVRSLVRSVRRKIAEPLTDDLVRDKFVDGLLDPALRRDLRRMVRRKPETTFLQARNEALRWTKEVEEDQQQQNLIEKETAELKNELLIVRKSVYEMNESLCLLVHSHKVLCRRTKRGKGRRRRRSRKKCQPMVDASSVITVRDSNQNCSPKQLRPEIIAGHAIKSPQARLSYDEDEPWGGWVLLPIPPDPGTSHASCAAKESSRACQERLPPVAAVKSPRPSHIPVQTRSHPKAIAAAGRERWCLEQIRHREKKWVWSVLPTCGDKCRMNVTPVIAAAC